MKKYVKVRNDNKNKHLKDGAIHKICSVKIKKSCISGIAILIEIKNGKRKYFDAGFFLFERENCINKDVIFNE